MYEISLDEKDYLEYQLYTASKSKRIRNIRLRGWIVWVSTFLLLSFLLRDKDFLSNYFIALALITSVFFPFYTRWRYKRHYLKFIREHYKNNFGVNCFVELSQSQIFVKDPRGEAKINIAEIAEVNEVANHIFIKFKTASALIIPKKEVNVVAFKNELKSHTSDHNIKWNEELTWHWK